MGEMNPLPTPIAREELSFIAREYIEPREFYVVGCVTNQGLTIEQHFDATEKESRRLIETLIRTHGPAEIAVETWNEGDTTAVRAFWKGWKRI